MTLTHFSIRRPVTTMMFFSIVVLFGVLSFLRLPIDLMPDITYPSITVRTEYPHVGPEEIEQLVTRPIEETVSSIQGVEKIQSNSVEGMSVVRVGFIWGTNLDEAANDVRSRVDRVRSRLPEDAESPIIYKFDLSAYPVVYVGLSGSLDPVEMRELVERQLKNRLERLPGVAAVDIRGGLKREIHVNLDRRKLTALDLSLESVLASLKAENLNLPAGRVDDGDLDVLVRTKGEYETLKEIENTVVKMRGGVAILLKDIGSVEDSHEEITRIVRLNGVPGLRMAVNKQSGSNTVQVAEAVIEELENINRDFPQIHVFPTLDTSDYIKRAIAGVRNATSYGALLAAAVLFLFLLSFRSTAIVSLSIPISILATFGLMYFFGFTLNVMTFGGLALGVGMLVDSAIVVLENIIRLRESGKTIQQAALEGTSEVATAVFASTLTTLVVFLPVLFIRGISGVTFKQLASVVCFALFCSLAVALTLIPVLCTLLFRRDHTTGSATGKTVERRPFFSAVESEYLIVLRAALRHRPLTILFVLVLLTSSFLLIDRIGVEFMPKADESEVRIRAEMAVGTRLEVVDKTTESIEQIVRENVPEAVTIYSRVGSQGWMGSGAHKGEVRVSLVPVAERSRSSADIATALRPLLAHVPGAVIRVREGQGLWLFRVLAGGEDEAEVQVRGHDFDTAGRLAKRVKEEMEQVEGITDVQISREEGQPEEIVRIDRAKAAALGLTVSGIARDIETSLSGTSATLYRDGGNEYKIQVRLKEADRLLIGDVTDMTVTSDSGRSVSLKNVLHLQRQEGPVQVEREDQERIVTVSGSIEDRDLGSVMSEITSRISRLPRPQNFEIVASGEYEEQQKAFLELLLGFALAIVLVYMVMASQFESLLDPFVVMFSIPLGVVGVSVMLVTTNTTFSLQAFTGCIMLVGIVVNNAIILVDYMNLLRRRDGMAMLEAVVEAARRRLRPVLMTTLTTSVGLTPLALGLGEGGEMQAPMARVVIGGLLSSAFITLIFIPVLYSLFEHSKRSSATTEQGGLATH